MVYWRTVVFRKCILGMEMSRFHLLISARSQGSGSLIVIFSRNTLWSWLSKMTPLKRYWKLSHFHVQTNSEQHHSHPFLSCFLWHNKLMTYLRCNKRRAHELLFLFFHIIHSIKGYEEQAPLLTPCSSTVLLQPLYPHILSPYLSNPMHVSNPKI